MVVIVPNIQFRLLPIGIDAAAADALIEVGVVVVPFGVRAAADAVRAVDLNAGVAFVAVQIGHGGVFVRGVAQALDIDTELPKGRAGGRAGGAGGRAGGASSVAVA